MIYVAIAVTTISPNRIVYADGSVKRERFSPSSPPSRSVSAVVGVSTGIVSSSQRDALESSSSRLDGTDGAGRRSPPAGGWLRPAAAAIWSLCVSDVDLVTQVLDIENVGDQIGRSHDPDRV